MRQSAQQVNWDNVDLVIFDVDGTLYDQRRLRLRMAGLLLLDAASSGSLETLRVLRAFRHCREVLAELADDDDDFTERQYEEAAFACDCSVAHVRWIVDEWIERRPLPYLMACRLPGIDELFRKLRIAGKTIAVLSDYPAIEKLKSLMLDADIVVSGGDEDVRRLKPNPRGLFKILRQTGVRPARALMVGDRYERDWMAAHRAGIPAIIRSNRGDDRCATFRSYRDSLFLQLGRSPEPWNSARLALE